MKVLVTGAAGFIGLRVVDRLADSGAVVHMVDMFKPAATDREFYEVLKKRGVKFEFFNRVKNIGLADDKKTIDKVEIGIQATLKVPDEEYQPLVDVKDLPCWPAECHRRPSACRSGCPWSGRASLRGARSRP